MPLRRQFWTNVGMGYTIIILLSPILNPGPYLIVMDSSIYTICTKDTETKKYKLQCCYTDTNQARTPVLLGPISSVFPAGRLLIFPLFL